MINFALFSGQRGAVAVEYLVVSAVSLALSFAVIGVAMKLLDSHLAVLQDKFGLDISLSILKDWVGVD